MDNCRKTKEFSLYKNSRFEAFVLNFLKNKKDKKRVFKSSMESEIFEQPEVISNLAKVFIDGKYDFCVDKRIKKVKLVASGSSYHCALLGVQLFRKYTSIDADSFYSGEFMLEEDFKADSDTLFVFISQSGKTYDTMECLKIVKKTSAKTLCITNCKDSPLYEMCDIKLLSTAGEEKSIASTKALTAQLFCLTLLALNYCEDEEVKTKEIENLKTLSESIENLLQREEEIDKIAKMVKSKNSAILLGSKECYALGKEGALKIKETSYINTCAYPMGEFLHGHVAVLNKKLLVLAALTCDNYFSQHRVIKKIREDYNPFIITIGTKNDMSDIKALSNINFDMEDENSITRMFLILIVFQIIALKTAIALHMNIDKPKGLKKVVS